MTHDVQQDNIKLQALVDSSNRVLADSEQRLAAINEQVEQKTADLAAARAEKGRVEQNRDVMKASLDTLKKRRDVYQKAAARTTGDTRQLDQEIQHLNQQIAELRTERRGDERGAVGLQGLSGRPENERRPLDLSLFHLGRARPGPCRRRTGCVDKFAHDEGDAAIACGGAQWWRCGAGPGRRLHLPRAAAGPDAGRPVEPGGYGQRLVGGGEDAEPGSAGSAAADGARDRPQQPADGEDPGRSRPGLGRAGSGAQAQVDLRGRISAPQARSRQANGDLSSVNMQLDAGRITGSVDNADKERQIKALENKKSELEKALGMSPSP